MTTETTPGLLAAPPDPAQLPESVQMLLLVTGKWVSQSIYVTAKLGLADLLAKEPQTAEQLAAATGVAPTPLYRCLRAAASVGVFQEHPGGIFTLTPLAETLMTDVAGSMRHAAIMFGEDFMWRPYGHIMHTVRTGQVAFNELFGVRDMFEYFKAHPDVEAVFNDAMTGLTTGSAAETAESYDFSRFGCVADIGGGHGYLLASILAQHPKVQGLLFDRPGVIEGAENVLAEARVEERVIRSGGDFFEAVPAGADAYVIKSVLHDWDDEQCLQILRNVLVALDGKPDGRVIIVESIVPELNEWDFSKLMDIEMMVNVGGRERTRTEWAALLERSGFQLTDVIPSVPPNWIIEGTPR
ncbi:MAG: O-methyltransferase [Propionibacteriales bacterium]|nr:O-methyltransferase [Propionibacteriales bacterium]